MLHLEASLFSLRNFSFFPSFFNAHFIFIISSLVIFFRRMLNNIILLQCLSHEEMSWEKVYLKSICWLFFFPYCIFISCGFVPKSFFAAAAAVGELSWNQWLSSSSTDFLMLLILNFIYTSFCAHLFHFSEFVLTFFIIC